MQREDVERHRRKAVAFLRRQHEEACFEQGDHKDEVDTPYSLGADAMEQVAALLTRPEAERDAAFAAGLEAAAEAVLYLCRMKGMGNRTIDGPEAAHLIRALPINPRP